MIGRRTESDLRLVGSDVSREHAEIVEQDGGWVLRDKGSRYGTYVNGERSPNTSSPTATGSSSAGPAAPTSCSSTGDAPAHTDRSQASAGQRPAPDGRAARRAARARLGPRAGRGAGAGARFGDRRGRRRARLHHAGRSRRGRQLEIKLARARAGSRCRASRLQDQPQDSRRGVRHRRAARSSPTCSTAISPTSTWAPWRSASATCLHRRCAWSATSTAPTWRSETKNIGVLYLDSREKGSLLAPQRAPRSRRWPPRPAWRSRTRGSTAKRSRGRGSNRN